MKDINVFIPAAGFGERLGPISGQIPKPLLPVMGRAVLDMVLDKISSLPVGRIGINAHYRWESLRDHTAASAYSAKIEIFHEKHILGTGGALRNAAPLLEQSVFLVHNADIISRIDLMALLQEHLASGNIATLAVHDYPEINNVWIDPNGRVRHVRKQLPDSGKGLRPVTYTGVAAYSPGFLRFLKEGKSNVVDAWMHAASCGSAVGTLDVSGVYWSDIGTPDAYSSAVFHFLKEEGEMVYVHPSVECDRINVGGLTVVEDGSVFEGSAFLRNCIILPGSRVRHGENIENAIAGPGFRVPIVEPLATPPETSSSLISGVMTGPPEKIRFTLIGTGGSERKYYRMRDHKRTAVLMECPGTDPDYRRHIVYARFFSKYLLPVAELLAEETGAGTEHISSERRHPHAIFEDLGDISLYSWTRCIRDPGRVENLYKKTLDILITLHTVVTNKARECPAPNFRVFDYDHLRWETAYFIENFVLGIKGIALEGGSFPQEEFDRLARKVDSVPKVVIHRDFQSQNIMVTEGDVPRLIDFQGARIGPPAYDLVSLLWDPYVRLDEPMRERLIDYYLDKMKHYYGDLFDEAACRTSILPCRLQRHMQALGAYGFLAEEKGKKHFLKHVPLALSYLREETESSRIEYPALNLLVRKLT
jgi:NDP-sugar pyrophosphorylase family protein/aminoglycoside/choline kinase family phosphotransferase